MKKYFAVFALLGLLNACGGIPLRSLPKLVSLQDDLLKANPAEFMVAIQADARMVPPTDAAPILLLTIKPSQLNAFEIIDRKIPMQFTVTSAKTLGLAAPSGDRRWLIYQLPGQSQAELLSIQNSFKRIQAQARGKGGGSISVGIAQEGVAARNPLLANTRWESWIQTSRQEGFYELWSGTVAELLKQAKAVKEN